jgi:hypothetical protein
MSCPERVGFPLYPLHYLNVKKFFLGRGTKKLYAFAFLLLKQRL